MAVTEDPGSVGRARLSFADHKDIDEFVDMLGRYEQGEVSAEDWRRFRLLRGTYGQRQPEAVHMLRVKIPQGIVSADQLEVLADLSERFSRGFGHITTRQNFQFHFVPLADVETAQRMLADAGMTTREACGNSVRTITGCPYAGVSADELFDVTPYADAMTRYFLRHPLAASLPRKFKIAFEGCSTDHAVTSINDIGLRARVRERDGKTERGFRVTVAGSTSIMCTTGYALFDFLPASELLEVAEAVLRVYHRLGDYQHRQRNRMKFLIKTIGWDRWHAEFQTTLAAVRAEGPHALPFDPEAPPVHVAPDWTRPEAPSKVALAAMVAATKTTGPGLHPGHLQLSVLPDTYARWATSNVRRQSQAGFSIAVVRLPLGDLTAGQFRAVAALARAYADGVVRVTPQQNLVMRWVPEIHLRALWAGLQAANLATPDADTVADVTSCPGAETCRLAVTHSRGLGRVLTEFLSARADLVSAADGADIKISGCPNGCGQHHIATFGFQGSVRRVGGKAAPQYFVMIGGGLDETKASFGRVVAKIPARRLTDAVERLIVRYRDMHLPGEGAPAFFQRMTVDEAKVLLGDLERLTPETAGAEDFVDLDQQAEFKPEVLDGECSA